MNLVPVSASSTAASALVATAPMNFDEFAYQSKKKARRARIETLRAKAQEATAPIPPTTAAAAPVGHVTVILAKKTKENEPAFAAAAPAVRIMNTQHALPKSILDKLAIHESLLNKLEPENFEALTAEFAETISGLHLSFALAGLSKSCIQATESLLDADLQKQVLKMMYGTPSLKRVLDNNRNQNTLYRGQILEEAGQAMKERLEALSDRIDNLYDI